MTAHIQFVNGVMLLCKNALLFLAAVMFIQITRINILPLIVLGIVVAFVCQRVSESEDRCGFCTGPATTCCADCDVLLCVPDAYDFTNAKDGARRRVCYECAPRVGDEYVADSPRHYNLRPRGKLIKHKLLEK